MPVTLRHAEPDDHAPIVRVVDEWWGGRAMADMLPRLFFVHFRPTSFIADDDERIVGFVVGFVSQTNPRQAYVRFVVVDPDCRGQGIGRLLYERFFAAARGAGCEEVLAVTAPVNRGSIAFHRAMGFEPLPGDAEQDGVPYASDYDGRGGSRVRFRRSLTDDDLSQPDEGTATAATIGAGPPPAGRWQRLDLGAADVRAAARLCAETLRPHVERDWSVRAADLDWDCRRTLEHIADVLASHAGRLAAHATERLPTGRTTDPDWSVADLLTTVEARAAVLAEVVAAAPPQARAYHIMGMADPSGCAAMACDELLAHTDDIARGLDIPFDPPPELLERVVRRLFPWAPTGFEPFDTFRWCNGRAALTGHPRQDKTWGWHCAPLREWDGTVRRFEP